VTCLKTSWDADFGARPDDGTKNEPLSRRLLETGLSLLDRRILFQRGLENAIEGDGRSCVCETSSQN